MTAENCERTVDVRAAMEQLHRLTLSEHSLHSVLQTVADLTTQVLPGGVEASASVLVADRPTTLVYTGQLALELDEAQYGCDYGPSLHAARTGQCAEIVDARTDPRWPRYMQQAVQRGSLSSLSIALGSNELMAAGLNIYSRESAAFTTDSQRTAKNVARFAGRALAHMHAYQTARGLANNLERALETRAVIDRAKGVLIQRHTITPEQALRALTHAATGTDRELRDVADHLVRTGEFLRPS